MSTWKRHSIVLAFIMCSSFSLSSEEAQSAPEASSQTAKVSVEKIEKKKTTEELVQEQNKTLKEAEEKTDAEKEAEEKAEQQALSATGGTELKIYTFNSLDELSVDHDHDITFAMTGTFVGHFKLYAELIRNGILAAFHRINQSGGIRGKALRLICVEDRSNPSITQKIFNKLRKQFGVDMFLGSMGTRSIMHNIPLIRSGKIAVLFPWGGSPELRSPDMKNIVNGLGDMQPQLEALVGFAADTLRHKKIALFHSDGSFSSDAMKRTKELLEQRGVAPVSIASYNRETMDIKTPAKQIITVDPKVVICFGSSSPTAKLISRFFEQGHYGTTFIGIDSTLFVSTILKQKGADYSYTSTVPDPVKSIAPIAQEFRHDLEASFPNELFNILSLSYYIHARILAHALTQTTQPADKDHVLRSLEAIKNFDLGGFTVSFDEQTRHAYPHQITLVKG